MPILKTRSRVLNVRMGEEEYEQFVRLAVVKGARSTSDLARRALTEFLAKQEEADTGQPVAARIAQLEGEMRRLSRVLNTLASAAKEEQ